MGKVYWPLYFARDALKPYVTDDGVLPPSSLRAAKAVIDEIEALGVSDDLTQWVTISKQRIEIWRQENIKRSASAFETVLTNDLPGLDIYQVSPKGIYSTAALIEHAEKAILDGLTAVGRAALPQDAIQDFAQAGRCLAFELPTAAGFHTMRSLEAVLRSYWRLVKKPPTKTKAPEMAQCINEAQSCWRRCETDGHPGPHT